MVYRSFDHADSASDPVHLVRRYPAPEDREIVAFCAAGLAFGRVASVLASIEALLAVLGPAPARFVRAFDAAIHGPRLAPLGHRWVRGKDLAALVLILQRMLRESGSLERFFLAGDDPAAADIGPALDAFSTRALETDLRPAYGPRVRAVRAGVCYFFPRPSAGSACKRLNLFLRWMVRKDAVDLGVWSSVAPSRLIVPLDTHVIRLGRCLRLTRRSSPGWKMAAEITAALRGIDPADPVRFDFSLCHVGMMGACGYGRAPRDSQCPLRGFCRPRPTSRSSRRSGGPSGPPRPG
ncbi:MAG: TIGR02757 family protein [Acidobacteria bacterium RIFCSPLOWO2_12_FULL_67_14]|nr:MAG: TIGR02757 family protein [Acidobacteria bacterium RIFCSPLOWO2_12_FULL_67_14]